MKLYYLSGQILEEGETYKRNNEYDNNIRIYSDLMNLIKYYGINVNTDYVYEVKAHDLQTYPDHFYTKYITPIDAIDLKKYVIDNFNSFTKNELEIIVSRVFLSEEFIENNYKKILDNDVIHLLLQYQKLSEEFIERHYEDIKDSMYLYSDQKLSEEFIEKHYWDISSDQFDDIYLHQKLSKNFIQKDINFVRWEELSMNTNISEDVFDTFYEFLDLYKLLEYQELSEKFLEKHYNEMPNSLIWVYQSFSVDFLQRHIKDIDEEDIREILDNHDLTDDYKQILDSACN